MTREEAFYEFKKILLPYTPDKEKLKSMTEQTDLLKDLKINSANLVDIIIDAESRYDIQIDNDSAEQMTNVGNCLDVIMKKADDSK